MAVEMITAGVGPVFLSDAPPPHDSPPTAHANWCARRSQACIRYVRTGRRYGLPIDKWLRAAILFRAARDAWRERAARETVSP